MANIQLKATHSFIQPYAYPKAKFNEMTPLAPIPHIASKRVLCLCPNLKVVIETEWAW